MNDLVYRDLVIAAIDPDNVFPQYIVETIKLRMKELPSAGKGRKQASKEEATPPNNSLTVLNI